MKTENKVEETTDVRSHVRERYGKIAASSKPGVQSTCCSDDSAFSSACCSPETVIPLDQVSQMYEASDVVALPDEVTSLSLGCGDPVTLASLEPGQVVLDLGSGGGIDCFLAASRVGETGRVIGVDMTYEMLEKARQNKEKLGAENVEFRLGEIEHLPVPDATIDVVISNCVINLSPDKPQVFRETYRVLKPGGRLAVSDIVTDGPLPEHIKTSLAAWAGCIAGALTIEDYLAAIKAAGFVDVKLEPVYMDDAQIDEAVDQLDLRETVINSGEEIYKTVLSAKVTARKPL